MDQDTTVAALFIMTFGVVLLIGIFLYVRARRTQRITDANRPPGTPDVMHAHREGSIMGKGPKA